jgi:phosphate transport system substrate-binding protein
MSGRAMSEARGSRGLAASAGLLIAICMSPVAAAAPRPLMAGGAGTALSTIKVLADEYRRHEPGFKLDVVPSLGSSEGIKAAAAGAVDFALVSRPLTEQERTGGLVSFEYGRKPFVVLTSKEGVENLTVLQLTSLIANSAATWEDMTYPQGKTLAIVSRDQPNEAARKFFDFIVSDKGRQVLVRLGHLVASPQ